MLGSNPRINKRAILNELCPNCGASLPGERWQGLCPRCVIAVSLGNGAKHGRAQPDSSAAFRGPVEISLPCWFGRYELIRVIGCGGMGVVYEARQLGLDRSVALKLTLRNGAGESSIARTRFQREAQAAAALRHPNIVAIHEFGEHEGQPFFSMDLVEGISLAELSRAGPIDVFRAARYTAVIAGAVAYAHSRNILHRDLKPANVLIDQFDQPRILDFGLAKRLDEQADLTCTGAALGSPSYMAPEQLGNRHAVGPASDIYALGAIAYQLITGRAPFVGADIESTLLRVLDSDQPAPHLLNPVVAIDLESVCLKCLEKEPTARYASAQLLAEDLDRFLGGEPTVARPLNAAGRAWRWCRRKPALAALALLSALSVVALVIVTLTAGLRLAQKEAVVRQNSYVADMHLVAQAIEASSLGHAGELLEKWGTGKTGNALTRSKKSNGSVTDLRGWEWRYFWHQCRAGEIFSLGPHETGTSALMFSPDGTQFVSGSFAGELKLWDLSMRREIASAHQGSSINALTYKTDGRQLAAASADHQVVLRDASDLHDGRAVPSF
jgi:hypothetical protein